MGGGGIKEFKDITIETAQMNSGSLYKVIL